MICMERIIIFLPSMKHKIARLQSRKRLDRLMISKHESQKGYFRHCFAFAIAYNDRNQCGNNTLNIWFSSPHHHFYGIKPINFP